MRMRDVADQKSGHESQHAEPRQPYGDRQASEQRERPPPRVNVFSILLQITMFVIGVLTKAILNADSAPMRDPSNMRITKTVARRTWIRRV